MRGPERSSRNQPRLKVVHIIQPSSGGIIKQLGYICSRLDRNRFDVHLIWSLTPGDPPYAEALRDVTSYRVDMTREISPGRDAIAFLRIFRLLRRIKPEVVHAHSSKAGVLGRLAAWLTGVPRIYYSAQGYSFLRTDVSPFSRSFYLVVEWLISHLGGTVIAVSPDEAVAARRVAPARRVLTAENCIDPSEFPPSLQLGHSDNHVTVSIGIVGRITAQKAPETFLEIAEGLESRLPDSDIRFIWVGDGEMRTQLEERLRRSRLRRGIEITGWLSPPDAVRWLGRLDIVVMPSRWEGLPLAVLEAMAAGKPVVASDVVGNRTTIDHGTTGFIVREVSEYVEALTRLVLDRDLRQSFGMAGRQRVLENFSVQRIIPILEAIYADDQWTPA